MDVYEIKNYTYYVFSSRNAWADSVLLFHGDSGYLGAAFFYEADYTLPDAVKYPTGPVGLHYHRADLPILIDVLRNESPVYLIWDGGQNSRISTTSEPVGEFEQAMLDAAGP